MSDFLAVAGGEAPSLLATNPLPTVPRTHAERFALAYQHTMQTERSFARERSLHIYLGTLLPGFRAAGAVDIRNPLDGYEPLDAFAQYVVPGGTVRYRASVARRDELMATWDREALRLRAADPENAHLFPTIAEARERALGRARALDEEVGLVSQVGGGWAGGLAGSMVGFLFDPLMQVTLPFGAPYRVGGSLLHQMGRSALVEAGIAGGTQAVVEATNVPFRVEAGLENRSVENVLTAMAAGAVLGGGLRGVLGLLERRAAPPGAVAARDDAGDAALQPDQPAAAGSAAADPDVDPEIAYGVASMRAASEAIERARNAEDLAAQRARDAADQINARLLMDAGRPGGIETQAVHEAISDAAVAAAARGNRLDVSVPAARPVPTASANPAEWPRFAVVTPAGRQVVVEPRVVDLDALIPSHLDDGRLNPAFPHAEGLQPRDRAAAPSQDQIAGIAARLNPARLEPNVEAGMGAPIVADDLVVESGNARVLALRQVYGRPELAHVAAAYRAHLTALGYNIDGMRRPVLVSARVSPLTEADRHAFVREANARATLAPGAAERARADARLIADALPLWRGGSIDSVENVPFVRRFLGGMTAEDRGDLILADGQISAAGVRNIQNALVAAAYGDELGPLLERFLATDNEGLRNVAGAMTDAAAIWATMRREAARGGIPIDLDITADLGAAARLLYTARIVKRISVGALLDQTDFIRSPVTGRTRALLAMLHVSPDLTGRLRSRPNMAAILHGYADEALKSPVGPDMFGVPPAGAAERLGAVVGRIDGEARIAAVEVDDALVISREIDAASRAEEALRDAGNVEAIDLAHARRILGEGDIEVWVPADGDTGGTVMISGRQLLDDADDAVRDATTIAVCLTGSAAT